MSDKAKRGWCRRPEDADPRSNAPRRAAIRRSPTGTGGRPPSMWQAQAKPTDSSQLEKHGTEMAGLLVGAGGPAGLAGVAPAATVLPIRVAGWQADKGIAPGGSEGSHSRDRWGCFISFTAVRVVQSSARRSSCRPSREFGTGIGMSHCLMDEAWVS